MKTVKFPYAEATLQQCLAAAERFAGDGANWHNHVLKPTCLFNPRRGRYALVIENNSSNEILVHFADRNPVDAAQRIVRLRHGAEILGTVDDTCAPEASEPEILNRIRDLVRRRVDWHHHMMFPDCVLNPRKGQWLVTLEEQGRSDILQIASSEEPYELLKKIEHLFFARETDV